MQEIFETSDQDSSSINAGEMANIDMDKQLGMSPEDLLALHLFSKDQVNFLKSKSLLVKNLYENQKFIDLFKRTYAIARKFKHNSPDGDEKLQKQLSEEIIRLLRAVSQTASKSLQNH